MRIGIKIPGEKLEFIETDKQYKDDLKKLIIPNPGIFDKLESVYLSEDRLLQLVVDECGHPKELPYNFDILTTNPYFPKQSIVGPVLFIRIKKPNYSEELWDYEIDDLSADDIEIINKVML